MNELDLFIQDIKDNCQLDSIHTIGNEVEVCLSHEFEEEKLMSACGRYEKIEKISKNGDVYGTEGQETVGFKEVRS